MYKMKDYTEQDEEKIISFMREFSFATVAGIGGGFPVASHLPLEVNVEEAGLFFSGHLMRKTAHHLAFEQNENVLVIFQSPHAYINAGWYQNPSKGSTVDYMAVHAKGKISFLDDEGTLEELKKLTEKHIGVNSPASFHNISDEYKMAMLKAIRGFKINVSSVEHVFKLSQEKNETDRKKIITELEKRQEPGSDFIAQQMKKRI